MVKIKKEEKAPQPLVAKPVRKKVLVRAPGALEKFGYWLASKFPTLEHKLLLADIRKEPHEYMISAFMLSLLSSVLFGVLVFFFVLAFNHMMFKPKYLLTFLTTPVVFFLFFGMWLAYPDVRAKKRARDIDKDIVFAGRHIVIALKSGVPLFDALVGVTQDYGQVSEEFRKIVEKVSLGEPMTQAMREVANNNPSNAFRRVVLQMVNALVSGSDVADALDAILDQVAQEQLIKLKEYGQKLNPFSMFFMLFGIVFPSLGVVFFTIVLSMAGGVGESLANVLLPVVFVTLVGVQFSFMSAMESSRPKVVL